MIYVTGDTHGDINRLSGSEYKKITADDTLIVCGDFGFIWNDSKQEQKNLKILMNREYDICFIDGAHENFERLNAARVEAWNGGKVHRFGSNIYHLMRGQVYNIEGQRIFTMGGGESPDIEIRYESDSWSKFAVPSEDELREGVNNINNSNFEFDIVISHEPPAKVKGLLLMSKNDSPQFTRLNTYFDELAKNCKYKKWYFGSMHMDKFISSTQIAVFKKLYNAKTGEIV